LNIGAIILAAGGSSRYLTNQHKLLAEIDGKSVIRTIVEKVVSVNLQLVLVVVGAKAEAISAEIQDFPVTVIRNENWNYGQSTSLKCGLRGVPPEVDSVCILLADQPFISRDTLIMLIQSQTKYPEEIIAPVYSGRRGNPIFFPRKYFQDLLDKSIGDSGGREIIREKGAHFVEVKDRFVIRDIDTIEDFKNYLKN